MVGLVVFSEVYLVGGTRGTKETEAVMSSRTLQYSTISLLVICILCSILKKNEAFQNKTPLCAFVIINIQLIRLQT